MRIQASAPSSSDGGLKGKLIEREKQLEELTFRLEEETIIKDSRIEELENKVAEVRRRMGSEI